MAVLRDIAGIELQPKQRVVYNGYSVSLQIGEVEEVLVDRITIKKDAPEVSAQKYSKFSKPKKNLDSKRCSDIRSGRVEVFVYHNIN